MTPKQRRAKPIQMWGVTIKGELVRVERSRADALTVKSHWDQWHSQHGPYQVIRVRVSAARGKGK